MWTLCLNQNGTMGLWRLVFVAVVFLLSSPHFASGRSTRRDYNSPNSIPKFAQGGSQYEDYDPGHFAEEAEEECLNKPVDSNRKGKDKVEYYGGILKSYVAALRKTSNRKVELAFLMDGSGSVGEENFDNELKFVRKMLADFAVDTNTTRVTVITFSSRSRVIRHIDHMTTPSNELHKCSLLEEELPKIKYTGGGTYTRGALLEAQKVFEYARPDAKKAVFLITDGYSNHGDPRDAAEQLRDDGVEIFTFGIMNGNFGELCHMASKPKQNHTYILDSFKEFEALARRALHEDLHTGTNIPQNLKKCNGLCKAGFDCCDRYATCSCGTYSGKYSCLCHPGYYGNGLVGGCIACPEGTYKNTTSNGGEQECISCPDINHVSPPGSTSIYQCTCKKGFRTQGSNSCVAMNCPKLRALSNGHFVNQKGCNTVYNAACGVRCDLGYSLIGSSVRLCSEDGTWSGREPYCKIKTCPRLRAPTNGRMTCTTLNFTYSTSCRFDCDDGYQLVGSETRLCLPIAHWNGLDAECREVTCDPLPKPTDGEIFPPTCSTTKSSFGTRCTYRCNSGYALEGPYSKQCTRTGFWTPKDGLESKCVDSDPPMIICPDDIVVSADKNENTARVTWTVPTAVDNSGFVPSVRVIPVKVPPVDLPIGKTKMTYIAEDPGRNMGKCEFTIHVKDTQPPRIDKCVSPPPFVRKNRDTKVTWEEPIFSDNSGNDVLVKTSHKPGVFNLGRTLVSYIAYDKHGNNNTCFIEVTVQENACANPIPPINGNISCVERYNGLECKLSCKKGYGFAMKPAEKYFCDYDNGRWKPAEKMPFPDCSASHISNHVVQKTSLKYKSKATCDKGLLLNQAEKSFRKRLSDKVSEFCDRKVICSLGRVDSDCKDKNTYTGISHNMIVQGDRREKREVQNEDEQVQDDGPLESPQGDQPEFPLDPDESTVRFTFAVSGELADTGPLISPERQQELREAVQYVVQKLEHEVLYGQLHDVMSNDELDFRAVDFEDADPEFTCQQGSVLINLACVKCPVGTFFDVVRESCFSCGLGTYQPAEGDLTCLVCPTNTSTAMNNSKSVEQCKGQCLPGSSSFDGLEPCETCPIGQLQSDYAQFRCLLCPGNTTTWRRGTRSVRECGYMCPEGYVSKTGLQPCFPCPLGHFQPEKGKSSCFLCPGSVRTDIVGSTQITDCEGVSGAQHALSSSVPTTQLVINECFEEPCENNATCLPLEVGYTCSCVPGWKGIHCEDEIDECQPNPCMNNASCKDFIADFECNCSVGYSGKRCEIDIDECASSPCVNNGTCIDKLGSYECECPVGLIGTNCEIDIDDCQMGPCRNGGTCRDLIGRFECVCAPGFSGHRCTVNIDECASSPCVNNGTCIDGSNDFSCACPDGYGDKTCSTELDECASNPCVGEATCIDLIGKFSCRCPPAYSGVFCDKKIDSEFDLEFERAGITDFVSLERMYDNVTEISVGFWMKTSDKENYGTPISYATERTENAFTITDYSGFVVKVNEQTHVTDVTAIDNRWHHICVTWSSPKGHWQIFKDGSLKDEGDGLANGTVLEAGGVWVLGQEQDARGSKFSAGESFVGFITRLNLWNRVLTLSEIEKLSGPCSGEIGNIRAWPDFLEGLHGQLKRLNSSYCTDCPQPTSIPNATMLTNGTSLGSTVTYVCDKGYALDGHGQLICDMFGNWEGGSGKCIKKRCGYPGKFDHGRINGQYFTYGNTISYDCSPGYRLIGNRTRYCNADGVWEGPLAPTCQEILCPGPPKIASMVVTAKGQRGGKYIPGVILQFGCRHGNRHIGSRTLQCDKEGKWSDAFPSCERIVCPDPPDVEHGTAIVRKDQVFALAQSVAYECEQGYRMDGSDRIRCVGDGSWAELRPRCVLIECSKPTIIPNATMVTNGTIVDSTVTYICDKGFVMDGGGQLTCDMSGNWKGGSNKCLKKRCGYPGKLDKGKVTGQYFTYGNTVSYECIPGYRLIGNETRYCNADGVWEGPVAPTCEEILCSEPEEIQSMTVTSKGGLGKYTPSVVLQFACAPGHRLIGPSTIECDKDGNWSDVFPSCETVVCADPPTIEHGTSLATKNQLFAPTKYASYECEQGYHMDGSDRIMCTRDGTWSEFRPHCVLVECPEPEITNGERFGASFIYEAQVKFVCDTGFNLVGEDTAICTGDGTWSVSLPVCEQITCPRLKVPDNAQLVGNSRNYNAVVTYHCNSGYVLKGANVRRCLETSNWNGTTPMCEPVQCGKPDDIEHGLIKGKDWFYEDEVIYTCNEGYELKGVLRRTCSRHATWQPQAPVCKRIECVTPRTPTNGRIVGTDYSFNSVIEFTCDAGYELVGNKKRRCRANHMWEGEVPTCKQIKCKAPFPIEHGHFVPKLWTYAPSKVIRLKCEKGYEVVGKDTRTCKHDGSWSGPAPNCTAILCSRPNSITNGKFLGDDTSFGSTIEYVCDDGYQLDGPGERTCKGNWTGSDPRCKALQCDQPEQVDHGSYEGDNRNVGSVITLTCAEGFEAKGTTERTCQKDQTWTEPAPYCEKIQCNKPGDVISNGRMIDNDFTFNATIHYVCDGGYYIDGSTTRTCQSDATWDNSIPVCERVECPKPLKPANCQVEGFDFRFQEKVVYTCKNGFRLAGSVARVCQSDGTWSGSEPECIQVQCPPPSDIDNGKVITQGLFYTNTIKYVCSTGFYLRGEESRECQANGTWSGVEAECTKVKCGQPPEINGGAPMEETTVFGDSPKYMCNDGFLLMDSPNLVCTENGSYSGGKPVCVEVECPVPDDIEHGRVILDGRAYGDAVSYTCDLGYDVVGNRIRICDKSGRWTGTDPTCNKFMCPELPQIANGAVETPDGRWYLKRAIYTCDDGYDMNGYARRSCLADKTWSFSEPSCVKPECPRPEVDRGYITVSQGGQDIEKHVHDLDRFVAGMVIGFDCERGYELIGSQEIECLSSKRWSAEIPTCQLVRCDNPDIKNAKLIAPDGLVYRAKIQVECKTGYKLVGKEDIFCGAEKTWTGALPTCTLKTCPQPQIPHGKFRIIEIPEIGVGYPYRIKLGFSCHRGYVLKGVRTAVCGANEEWELGVPECVKIMCEPPLIINARLSITQPKTEYDFDDIITFFCKEDYQLEGNKHLTCGDARKWNGTLPTCRRKECPTPNIENGYFRTDVTTTVTRFGIGMELQFHCDSGYKLQGEPQLTCRKNQTWSSDIPMCKRVACPKLSLEHGQVIVRGDTIGNEIGARVTFNCGRGYRLKGAKSAICQNVGKWSVSIPVCEIVSCPTPDVANGIVTPNEQMSPDKFLYGDVITIGCENGYYVVGKTQFTCQDNGLWRGLLTKCEPVVCPPFDYKHGIVTLLNKTEKGVKVREFTYTMLVAFSCEPGYILVGDAQGSCLADGSWSISEPRCQPLACPELNISNAFVNSSAGDIYNLFGLTAEVYCEMGFELIGDGAISCHSSGEWEGTIPRCLPTKCPDPSIENGKYTAERQFEGIFTFGDSIRYECDSGYELKGESEKLCLPDKTWYGGLPSCERVWCKEPSLVLLGGVIDVVGPDGPHNFTYQTKLKFKCDEGLILKGPVEIECGAQKEWSGVYPVCEEEFCSNPYIEYGQFIGAGSGENGGYIFGDSVRFICDPGFYLSGEPELLCVPGGQWLDVFPVCERIYCPEPQEIPHGNYTGDRFRYEDLVLYTCDEGYEIEGVDLIHCQADRSWSGSAACVKVNCPLPTEIAHGEYMMEGFSYGDKIEYDCFEGYELDGEKEHFCLANKTWSGIIPICPRVQCVSLPLVPHAILPTEDFFYGDKVNIVCEVGYKLDGSGSLQCLSTRKWSAVEGRCKIINCSPPSFPEHGTIQGTIFNYQSIITYECDKGYEIVGESQRTCLETKQWSGQAATCARITCRAPETIENGFIEGGEFKFGLEITYKCIRGYEMEGRAIRECLADGGWSGEVPKCVIIMCSLPPEITNGHIVAQSTTYESTIKYVCDEGYELKGIGYRLCQSTRKWTGTTPTCEKVDCGEPPTIKNGYFEGDDFTFGSTINFFCNPKYELFGDSVRVCESSRAWSGNAARCRLKTCPPPQKNPHAQVLGDDYSVGSSVSFLCDEGYLLAGSKKLTCKDGDTWSGEVPFCDKVSCGLPKPLDNAVIFGDSYEFEDVVEYRCNRGYKNVEENTITCLASGTWTELRAKCIRVSCGQPPVIENAIILGNDFNFKDHIIYKCNTGFEMTGNNLIQCGADGLWSGSLPTCNMVTCGKPSIIPFASIIVEKTTYGSKATYQCNNGYVLKGSASVRCEVNGTWVYDQQPSCEPVNCGTPPALENGGVKVPDVTFGNIARYYCQKGYVMEGSEVLQCDADGFWHGQGPQCVPVRCPAPLPPKNGHVTSQEDDSFIYGKEIAFNCNQGYKLVGATVSKCLESGSWSGTRPRCDLVYCGPPDIPANGNVTANGHHYGSVLRYVCSPGYELVGNESGSCLEDGFWDVAVPVCLPVPTTTVAGKPCPLPITPQNVVPLDGQFMVGDSVILACAEGYVSAEPLSITCQEDLSWSTPRGFCKRISCGPPEADPLQVMVMGHSFLYGDKVSYMCRRGLNPGTEPLLTCQANGQWDLLPVCRASCKFECQNGGMCIGRNKCKCQPGYGGRFCEKAICILPCLHGGRCTAPYQCSCPPGYAGDRCERPVCFPPCQNGGMCIRPDRCSCPHGFKLPFCTRPPK